MVCSVIRATSKRLCFMASMARSNRTLSGCLDPTFDSGLLTFLLVQPTANASTPNRRMTGIRRDIEDLGKTVVSLQSSTRKPKDLPTTEDRRLTTDFRLSAVWPPPQSSTFLAHLPLDRLYRRRRCLPPEFRLPRAPQWPRC